MGSEEYRFPLFILNTNNVNQMRKYLSVGGGNPHFNICGAPLISHAHSVEMGKLLVEYGADIHHRGYENRTPLHDQSVFSRPIMVGYLLSLDPNLIKDVDSYGETALHKCAVRANEDRLKCAEILLAANPPVDINAKNKKGFTALDLAIQFRYDATEEMIQLLLDHGASRKIHPNSRKIINAAEKIKANMRNTTKYAQAYRGLAEELPENTVGVVQGFLEGATPGPHRYPSRYNTPYSLIRRNTEVNTRTPGGSRKTLRRREQRARAKAREIQSKAQTPKTRRSKNRK
jgi:hypothetical protein